jgi:hypothetical protein
MHPTGPTKKSPVLDWRHVIVASGLAIIALLVYRFDIHP